MRSAAACLLALTAACGRAATADGAEELARYEGASMGSSWHASVLHLPQAPPPAPEILQGILDEVDRLMSTWKPESELSRFNAWVPQGPDDSFPVSPWTAEAVAMSLAASADSDGAFDPTVLPLVELWGFGAAGARTDEPSAAQIEAALERVGWRRVQVRANRLSKEAAGVGLDLSGSAPGFAADLISARLVELGFPNHLVEVGGEVLVHGHGPAGRPWRIGIEQPMDDAAQGEFLNTTIEVRDCAITTSGDYRKFRLGADGRRLSHEIDPRTGRPITHALASVTVIAPQCGPADALATAFMVLGPEAALALAERLPAVEAYLLVREGGGFRALRTSGFPQPAD